MDIEDMHLHIAELIWNGNLRDRYEKGGAELRSLVNDFSSPETMVFVSSDGSL